MSSSTGGTAFCVPLNTSSPSTSAVCSPFPPYRTFQCYVFPSFKITDFRIHQNKNKKIEIEESNHAITINMIAEYEYRKYLKHS